MLFLESDADLLRVPLWRDEFDDTTEREDFNVRRTLDNNSWWDSAAWFYSRRLGEYRHPFGDLPVSVNHPAYLVTGGKLVMSYGLRTSSSNVALEYHDLEPGEYLVEIEARLPRGVPAGSYELRVLPGSLVVLLDGAVEGFDIDGPADLTVESDVEAGWDGGVPPLDFDVGSRQVRGAIEMRLAKADGTVPGDGEPVAEGLPGQEISFRVQFRTEVPLNYLWPSIQFPGRALGCLERDDRRDRLLFTDPTTGHPYSSESVSCYSSTLGLRQAAFGADFLLQGGTLAWVRPTAYWGRGPLLPDHSYRLAQYRCGRGAQLLKLRWPRCWH